LSQNAKHNRPLTVVVTKFDVWSHLLEKGDLLEPSLHVGELVGLDMDRIERVSQRLRQIMLDVCPEVVAAAESFAPSVNYLPVSALGRCPRTDSSSGKLSSIRPRDIRPIWVTIPLLHWACRALPGLVGVVRRKPGHEEAAAAAARHAVRQNALPDH
jgi:hypothetical protein